MSKARHDHRWLQAKLEAHALGLATPDVGDEIAEHLPGCSECQELLRALRRELLNSAAGPRSGGGPAGAAEDPPPAARGRQVVFKLVKRQLSPGERRLVGWALAGVAALAIAAFADAAFNPGLARDLPRNRGAADLSRVPCAAAVRLPSQPAPRAPSGGSVIYAPGAPSEGVMLSGATRGEGGGNGRTADVPLQDRQCAVRFHAESLTEVRDDAAVVVSLSAAAGRVLATAQVPHRALWSRDQGVVFASSAPFEPGRYVLRLQVGTSEGPSKAPSSYEIELHRKQN